MKYLSLILGFAFLTLSDISQAQQGQAKKPLMHKINTEAQGRWAKSGRARIQQTIRAQRGVESGARMNILEGTPTSGTMKQVLVTVAFKDEPFIFTTEAVTDLYYGTGSPGRYSLPQFFKEASRGLFSVEGVVVNTVVLPKTRAAYIGSRQNSRFAGVADSLDVFMKDVLAGLDSTTDLSSYADASDPRKRIAALVILQTGEGGECGGANGGVWAHRYNMTELLGAAYETKSKVGGQPVLIDDYITNSALECGVPGALGGAGTVMHETGHLIGLPDLYATDQASTNPVGQWDLMGSGNYYTADTPSQLGAWSRFALGWTVNIPMEGVAGAGVDYVLNNAISTGEVGVSTFQDTPEFLLLESRTQTGSDIALPGEGLLIWKVDPRVINEESIESNTVNNNPASLGVRLIQADGKKDLEQGVNQGDGGDVFPGISGQAVFGATSNPAWTSSQGIGQGEITGISFANGISRFKISRAAVDTANSTLIKPDSLPRAIAGRPYPRTLIYLNQSASTGVVWSADSIALKKLGLGLSAPDSNIPAEAAFGERAVVLSGTLPDTAQTLSLNISAVIPGDGTQGDVLVRKTYQLVVVSNPELGLERLAKAILEANTNLSEPEVTYYDAHGNQNGQFDLGDIVLGLKKGLIKWTPGTIIPKP